MRKSIDFAIGYGWMWRASLQRNNARLTAVWDRFRCVVSPQNHAIYRFGVFELDLRAAELRKSGAKVRLQDQPFAPRSGKKTPSLTSKPA
jgi:hypothetical protein